MHQQAGQQPPERAADTQQGDIGGGGQKGDQRGLAGTRIAHRAGQAATDGAQQGQPGEGGDESARQHHEQAGQGHAENPHGDVEHPAGDAGEVAPGRVGVRVLAGADGRSDGGHVERMGAKRRHQQRPQPGDRDDRVGAGGVAVVAQHQHARHVLPGEGDDEQRQRHAEQRAKAELRGFEHRQRHAQVHAVQVQALLGQQHGQARHQHPDHGKARGEAAQHGVGEHQHDHQQRVGAGPAEGVDPELQQDACQQPGGDAGRYPAHQPLEHPRQPQQDEADGAQYVGADHLAIRRERHDRGQERHARGGPGGDDRRAVAPAQPGPGQAHADAHRPHPRGGLRGGQVAQLRGLEHQHEGAAIVDHDADQGGQGG
ncbi:hypothetical protein AO392_04160 [Pseudomonas putida]|nr:hypothetical protein AO392_04160 [Pseudomonas putida]